MAKVAVNGLGRIGRAALKILLETSELELVAVNDIVPAENLAYLLQYDTAYGRYKKAVSVASDHLVVDGTHYQVFQEKDPAQLPWDELDIDKYLSDELGDPFDRRLESLDQLQMASGQYEWLGDFLEYAESVRTNSGNDENGVTLSTVHKAKGLEFPVVFVIGLVDGVMPNSNGDSEEERRIAFVAMSRAMKVLYLSHTMSYQGRAAMPSPFIAEAFKGKEVVEK